MIVKMKYKDIIGNTSRKAQAIQKLLDLYIPDVGEMMKLIPLSNEIQKHTENAEKIIAKVKEKIDEEMPAKEVPEKPDENLDKWREEKAEIRKYNVEKQKKINQKINDLLDEEIEVDVKRRQINIVSIEKALKLEEDKKDSIKCQNCGNSIDIDKSNFTARDFAYLTDFVRIEETSDE